MTTTLPHKQVTASQKFKMFSGYGMANNAHGLLMVCICKSTIFCNSP